MKYLNLVAHALTKYILDSIPANQNSLLVMGIAISAE
jgi:hypothetical protein